MGYINYSRLNRAQLQELIDGPLVFAHMPTWRLRQLARENGFVVSSRAKREELLRLFEDPDQLRLYAIVMDVELHDKNTRVWTETLRETLQLTPREANRYERELRNPMDATVPIVQELFETMDMSELLENRQSLDPFVRIVSLTPGDGPAENFDWDNRELSLGAPQVFF
jgi:hypothetical protein